MYKLLSCAALGLIASGATLVTPEQSKADPPGFSIRFGYNSGGYGNYGRYGSRYGSVPRYSTYGRAPYRGPSCGTSFYGGRSYNRRPAVVHPETLHWTPRRGLHTHGHIHVPHRGHYHTIPY